METIGFPIGDLIRENRITFYNNLDWANYNTHAALLEDMIKDGFTQCKDELLYTQETCSNHPPKHALIVEWGMRKLLQTVVDSNKPTLVLENDIKFDTLTYDMILYQWETLVNLVGYESIQVAMLCWQPTVEELDIPEVEVLTEFWGSGVKGMAQYANIFTPAGAKFFVERKDMYPTIENYFVHHPTTPGFYTALDLQNRWGNLASMIYPHKRQEIFDPYRNVIEGEYLHEVHNN